jgi:hypothetical protein
MKTQALELRTRPNSKLKLLSSNVFACINSPWSIFTCSASSEVKVCQF